MSSRRRVRQVLLLVHVVASTGWMGSGAANVVLAATALGTTDAQLRHSCYVLIDRVDWALVIPLAFSTLLTGVVSSLATPWGLARHWWVLVKLVLTVAVIVFSTVGVGAWVETGIAATAGESAGPSPVALPLVVGAASNLVAFLVMCWLSVAKPWPRTPWSRRPTSGRRRRPVPQAGDGTFRPGPVSSTDA